MPPPSIADDPVAVIQSETTTGGGNMATVNYTTPANLNPAGPLELTLSGDITASLLGGQVVFSSATFDQVPEPGAGTAVATGLSLLGGAQLLRRARRA